jgi:hypothetical protein
MISSNSVRYLGMVVAKTLHIDACVNVHLMTMNRSHRAASKPRHRRITKLVGWMFVVALLYFNIRTHSLFETFNGNFVTLLKADFNNNYMIVKNPESVRYSYWNPPYIAMKSLITGLLNSALQFAGSDT